MGILDIFKRHHNDDLSLDLPEEKQQGSFDFGSTGQDAQPQMPGPTYQGFNQPQGYGQAQQGFGQPGQPQGYGQNDMTTKELEIISSKLDSIRAMLESLNQRVSSLERVAYGDQSYGNQRRY